jgi:hypothetical protein
MNKIKILATLQAMLLTLTLMPLVLSDTSSPTGSFDLGNVAPTAPTVLGVQDTSNAGIRDTSTPDTHMIFNDYFNISWIGSTDSNGETVYYRLCIASSSGARDIENCDIVDKMSNGDALSNNYYVTTDGDTGLTYNGELYTVYVRIIATDKQGANENSTAYDSSFDILNSPPSCSGMTFTPLEVHGDLSPNLDWSDCTDPDDGLSADYYPADELIYSTVTVGDATYGDDERVSETNLPTSQFTGAWDADLVYGNSESSGWVNKTYYVGIQAYDGYLESEATDGWFDLVLYDNLPDVTSVQITDAGQPYTNQYLTPVEGLKSTVAVKINATDLDGDCASGHTAYIHLCLNATAGDVCNETNYNQVWQVEDASGSSGTTCIFVFTANKTTSNGYPSFWIAPAIYKLYTNITAGGVYGTGIIRASDTQRSGTWEFKSLQGIAYTTTVSLGTLTMGTWNSGTNDYILNNTGNVLLDILWNASDFVNGTDTTSIDSLSEFQIDDDNTANQGGGETGLTPFTFNTTAITTTKEFPQTGGLAICNDDACVGDGQNTYYHMNLETGLPAKIYTNTINLETEVKD